MLVLNSGNTDGRTNACTSHYTYTDAYNNDAYASVMPTQTEQTNTP